MLPSNLRPMRLSGRPQPFDSDAFIYELKIDGFRALARIADGRGELVSRNGNVFRGFKELATWLAEHPGWEQVEPDVCRLRCSLRVHGFLLLPARNTNYRKNSSPRSLIGAIRHAGRATA